MKISLVTTCKNAAPLIQRTLDSVKNQTLFHNLKIEFEYIIVDSNSTDNTKSIVLEYTSDLPIIYICEPDRGIYDGLKKGFRMAKGELIGYINAGDVLFPSALEIIYLAFEQTSASWLTGYATYANAKGHPWRVSLPFRYKQEYFECGIHGSVLPTLQQESTFWRRHLLSNLDYEKFSSLKLAGDFYLWQHFAKTEKPYILHTLIGSFSTHPNQLSSDQFGYLKELKSLCRKPKWFELILAYFEKYVWFAPEGVKRKLAGGTHIVYDLNTENYVITSK